MRTIKKLMSLLLVLTMIAAFFGVTTASADTEDVSLTVAKSGETVTMTLTANKALDFGGLSFNYGFDDAAFSYTEGSFTSPIGTTATENTGNKYLAIDSANQINVAAGEAIISMTFQVAAGYDETKDYNFSMAMSEAYPFDWQADPYSWENETLTETLKGSGATQEPETVDLSEIMINKTVAGTGFDPITFTFNVVPDGTAPVMFQNNKVTLDVTTAGEFTVALANPEAGFTAEGTYQYTISEEDGGVKDWEYDDHVFVLNVVVREVSEGVYAPLAAFVLPEGSTNEEDKCDIEFTNSYSLLRMPQNPKLNIPFTFMAHSGCSPV